MQNMRLILACSLLLGVAAGCGQGNGSQRTSTANLAERSTPETTSTNSVNGPMASAEPQSPEANVSLDGQLSDPLRGTVKEAMDAGGYTYIRLASDQGECWAAARRLTVKVGDEVELAGLMTMKNFSSPSLKRSFEEIQFVGQAKVLGGATATSVSDPPNRLASSKLPAGHPPVGGAENAAKSAASALTGQGVVAPPAGGVTVGHLFDNKEELKGKLVRFGGRVVKANRGILGSNWLHIQDGTGESASNDITVTSKTGFAPVGNLVVVEGTLNLDRDFGAGYKYAVIVEDATITTP